MSEESKVVQALESAANLEVGGPVLTVRAQARDAIHVARSEQVVIKLARIALGDHFAPDHCYSTGPKTGDPFTDLVWCPGCALLKAFSELDEAKRT